MASTHTSLDTAATERKARLAKLASLKRKQPATPSDEPNEERTRGKEDPRDSELDLKVKKATDVYLSGRNFDVATRGPKLGFENDPSANTTTLEEQATEVQAAIEAQAAKAEAEAENGIDLFKLQPKRPNWDLKRDLAEKMKILDVRTQNAIARLVRERIENTKRDALHRPSGNGPAKATLEDKQGEEVGIAGNELVEGVHQREREEEEEERRERDLGEDENIV